MFEEAGAEFGWAWLSLQPWHRELCSGPPGSEARWPGDLLELTSRREALQEEQGTSANSELFALHRLPGAQAPFLVNILDGRTKNNSPSPLRDVEAQSQEHGWWG